ncbi:hypothetical protein D3C72_2101810 [compost metagenome]
MTGISPNLKDGLRQAFLQPGRHMGYPHPFGMKSSGAESDQHHGEQNQDVVMSICQQKNAQKRASHPKREKDRPRMTVRCIADNRLNERRGDIERERDPSNLSE